MTPYNTTYNDELQALRDGIADYASELAFIYAVMQNKSLSGNMKAVLIKACDYFFQAKHKGKLDEHNRAHMYRTNFAQDTGLGASTVSRCLKELGESGILEVDHRFISSNNSSNGLPQKEIWVSVPIQTKLNPKNAVLLEARNHGGARNVCAGCGSKNLELLRRVTCRDCGQVLEEVKRPLHKVEPVEDALYHDPIYEEELYDLADIPERQPMTEQETHEKLGVQFYQWFTSLVGCRLRINDNGDIVLGVPGNVTEERYLIIEKKVMQYDDVIRAILEREKNHESKAS